MNLYQNEEVLPTFFQELPIILEQLGPENVYVSIYENNSEDKTQELLGLLGDLLGSLGTPHYINSKGNSVKSHKEDGHRINFLAEARNIAMEPLYSGEAARHVPTGRIDEVLFINDIYHCASDILEVILQKRTQGANQACAVDWGGRVVYDRWIIRSMTGRTFYHWEDLVEWYNSPDHPPGEGKVIPPVLPDDPADRARFQAGLPMQVFSCWNGATVFDAAAFLAPHNIRFRISDSDYDEHGVKKTVTEKASECFLTSVDMWKAGLGKIMIVPKASVAYNFDDYPRYRKDAPLRGSRTLTEEKIQWVTKPPAQVMFQDRAVWYEAERWGKWDEQ
ncbi:hypothetical protein DL93DRAFT_2074035 [Clavulina sp. PMI_390]|nr:hypothetical protein DL93DRAFT_2074035 [Clavulina sp. PMI_390]